MADAVFAGLVQAQMFDGQTIINLNAMAVSSQTKCKFCTKVLNCTELSYEPLLPSPGACYLEVQILL